MVSVVIPTLSLLTSFGNKPPMFLGCVENTEDGFDSKIHELSLERKKD